MKVKASPVALIARKIIASESVVYVIEEKELCIYRDGIYVPGLEYIRKEIRRHWRNSNQHQIDEVLSCLRDARGHHLKEFDANPDILNLRNGLLNLRTGKFESHRAGHLSLRQLPIEYHTDAKCPSIDRFFREIVKPECVPALYEIAGYCLLRDYPIQVFVFLLGDGSNGKSTYLSLLRAFLGKENVSHVTIQSLANDRFAAADLFGMSANLCADIPSKSLFETGMVKSLVGRDAVTAQQKYGQRFSFVNYAKLIFSGNQLPASPDESDAWFRRYFSVDFPFEFSKVKGNVDADILTKLTTPGELSGLLNAALDSLFRLLKSGEFTGTKSLEAQRHEYKMRSDSVYAFLQSEVELDSEYEDWLPKQEVYEGYLEYCGDRKLSPLNRNGFYDRVPKLVPVQEYYAREGQDRAYAWRGIRWIGSAGSTLAPILVSTKEDEKVEVRT